MTEQEIHTICEKYNINNYSINPDGSIDVDGNVNLTSLNLTELPLKFNKVSGYFNCSYNKLTSLKGSPKEVESFFTCYDNKINDLKYAPNRIGGWFDGSVNNLKNLKNSPTCVNLFFCEGNPLESLEGYNNDYNKLECDNVNALILKSKRKQKLIQIKNL